MLNYLSSIFESVNTYSFWTLFIFLMRVIKSDVEFHVIVVLLIIGGYKDNTNLSIFLI